MLQRQRQKLNKAIGNRGFSLVELLVVVAIMGVMVGIASLSYVVVSKSNVKKTAGFIADAISECRERSMTKTGKWSVKISDGLVEIIHDDEVFDSSELPSRVNVYVSETDGKLSGTKVGTDYTSVTVTFRNLSGDIEEVSPAGIKTDAGKTCYIMCRYKDKKSSTIKLYYSTGKHTVEEN